MAISWINLELIIKNPFQTRDHEDPEHVKTLAESIRERGLMQMPVAREFEGFYQLAFGHSRFAAYQLLYMEAQDNQWLQMPVQVQELTDQAMFEMAVAENLERKNLTPIEEARAMAMYRDKFRKTSDEIGKLFHLGGSAVRNKMRLLDLPEAVQAKIGGDISEGTARKLLTLAQVAPAEKVTEISEALAMSGEMTPEYVTSQVKEALKESAFAMWNTETYYHRDGEPSAGAGLWPLTWTPGILESSRHQVENIFEVRGLQKLGDIFLAAWWPAQTGQGVEVILRANDYPAEQIEPAANILTNLANPPACTNCPFHTVLDGGHWCSLKVCWERKRKAWYQVELERLSKEMGIPAYDKEKDGKLFGEAGTYGNALDKYRQWIADKADHLRLKIDYQEYNEHTFTKSYCITVISVQKEVVEKLQAEKEKASHRDEDSKTQQQQWDIEKKNREASERFLHKVAAPFMVFPLTDIGNLGFFEWLVNDRNGEIKYNKAVSTRNDKLQACRYELMRRWLNDRISYSIEREGPVAVAKHLQGVAKSWGLELPEDWLAIAEKFAPGYQAPAELQPEEIEEFAEEKVEL